MFTDLRDDTHDAGNALLDVWMSHGIEVNELPIDFKLIASTDNCAIAGIANVSKHYYGLQFHPEVTHTKQGNTYLIGLLVAFVAVKKTGPLTILLPT